MTSDERIEKLLNRAGQTMLDCPAAHTQAARGVCRDEVKRRTGRQLIVRPRDYQEMILHLADVIDRLEWALENRLTRVGDAPKPEAEAGTDAAPEPDGATD